MTYFLIQHRYCRPSLEETHVFPAVLTVFIRFGPPDAFGVQTGGARTTGRRAEPARVVWNANEGVSAWESALIDAIQAESKIGHADVRWSGNTLRMELPVDSANHVNNVVGSLNHLLPAFLSLRLRVFVWIQEFTFSLGNVGYRFETASNRYSITLAAPGQNSKFAVRGISDWVGLRGDGVRLVMAIYYYRHAQRIAALEPDRQSMAAEVVLNLAKCIEILFTSDRDLLRSRATEWGFEEQFIERWIVPILLVRNELDVAHVASAPLETAQHQTILDFLSRAFFHVHTLLEQILDRYQSRQINFDPISSALDRDKERLLRRMEEYASGP